MSWGRGILLHQVSSDSARHLGHNWSIYLQPRSYNLHPWWQIGQRMYPGSSPRHELRVNRGCLVQSARSEGVVQQLHTWNGWSGPRHHIEPNICLRTVGLGVPGTDVRLDKELPTRRWRYSPPMEMRIGLGSVDRRDIRPQGSYLRRLLRKTFFLYWVTFFWCRFLSCSVSLFVYFFLVSLFIGLSLSAIGRPQMIMQHYIDGDNPAGRLSIYSQWVWTPPEGIPRLGKHVPRRWFRCPNFSQSTCCWPRRLGVNGSKR